MSGTGPSFVVVGHGLAGAVLCETLRARGSDVRVVHADRTGSASPVAAGVVNPIVLRRTVPSWRAAQLLPIAGRFYRSVEARLGIRIWHPIALKKVFGSAEERAVWDRVRADPQLGEWLEPPGSMNAHMTAPHGAGGVRRCAWLDVPALINAQRVELAREGRLFERIDEIDAAQAGTVVHTTGAFAQHPGLVPVKGEVLTLRIPGLRLDAVVHKGAFLLPLGNEHFRLGATFEWNDPWSGPTQQARDELLRRLANMTDRPVEVVDHRAGVRPTAKDRRPIIGSLSAMNPAASPTGAAAGLPMSPQGTLRHPDQHHYLLNGLGSRGVLLAPWCAAHLADHMLHGMLIDPEVDAARFAP